ncbi:unnamed protein product [Calicophoron daubneyi]|uniref:Mitochondrial ribosomal protein L42 n=1 Tax=Calicophoron daubneyi TaxID=300641 RepID=A0AAV2TWM4_CALDB
MRWGVLFSGLQRVRFLNRSHFRGAVSSSKAEERYSAIVFSSDGATVMCWHPPLKVCYEDTKAIPMNAEQLRAPRSPLNVSMDTLPNANQYTPSVLDLSKAFGVPWQHFRPKRFENRFSPYVWAPLRERKSL